MTTEHTNIVRHEMCVVLLGETFSNEVTEMTENNEHEVADVCCDEDIIRGFFYRVFADRFVGVVLRDAAIVVITAVTKFCVNSAETLFGGRRGAGIRKDRAVVVRLVKNGVL